LAVRWSCRSLRARSSKASCRRYGDARALAVVFGRIGNVGAEGLQEDRNDSRIVHVERMHLPDPTPDNHIEACFDADGTGTLMTMRMTLLDAATRASSAAWKRASSGLRP
jgi:hypothetical protein